MAANFFLFLRITIFRIGKVTSSVEDWIKFIVRSTGKNDRKERRGKNENDWSISLN